MANRTGTAQDVSQPLDSIAAVLEGTGDYRVLRRLQPLADHPGTPDEPTFIGLVVDVETTGTDFATDEVIELGILKFEYGASGRIYRVLDTLNQLHEPQKPIPTEITRLPDDGLYAYPAFTPHGESLVWHFSFFTAANNLARTLIAGKERFFLEYFIKVHATNTVVFTPEVLDLYARSYAKPNAFDAAFAYYRALNETARRNKPLASMKLAMPVLAIGGGGHGGFGEAQAQQVGRYASNVTGVSLPGCGHWLPEECADALNPLVTDFLAHR